MTQLYKVGNPINREGRKNLNLTFEDILKKFAHFQFQINFLAGDNDVDELIKRIAEALDNSETTLEDLQIALVDAQQVITDMVEITAKAVDAASDANQAAADTNQLISEMTDLQMALEQLQTSLDQSIVIATQATAAATTATNNANQATQDARQATTDADNAASRANNAADAIDGWGQAVPYQSGTYSRNNVVTYDGSTYQSLADGNTALPTDGTKWIVLARKGLDGQGAVQTVNSRHPDENGNAEIGIPDIDGLQTTLNEKAEVTDLVNISESLGQLETNFTKHLDEKATEVTKGHVELATAAETTAGTDNTRAVHPSGLKVALDKKVNKVHGSWIEGTLINGWSGNIRFSTNDLNVATIDIRAYGGTVVKGTIICKLPVGYRPPRAYPVSALTDTYNIVPSAFYIEPNGDVKIGSILTAEVYHFTLATFVSI